MNENNKNSKVIDELNERIEIYEDLEMEEEASVLKSFYDWYIEEFIG